MTATLVIEPMAGRDVDAVVAIDAECFSRPWSPEMWHRELASDDRCHLIARDNDQVAGHAGTALMVDELHIITVAVDPIRRGQGIASRLVLDLLVAAIAEGRARSATLEVRASDHATQRLYSRFGFAPAGVRPSYYSAPSDDAIVMWIDDLASPDLSTRLHTLATGLGAPWPEEL